MSLTNFSKQVYKFTALIPRGRVATYQALARAIKNPEAVRAVGNALNKNPFAPQVPCHRVVRSNGEVGGYANGQKKKIAILKKEGIVIKKNRIDLTKYRYEFTTKK